MLAAHPRITSPVCTSLLLWAADREVTELSRCTWWTSQAGQFGKIFLFLAFPVPWAFIGLWDHHFSHRQIPCIFNHIASRISALPLARAVHSKQSSGSAIGNRAT